MVRQSTGMAVKLDRGPDDAMRCDAIRYDAMQGWCWMGTRALAGRE